VQKYGEAVLQHEDGAEALHCAWHPDRDTRLRCARCSRPMCPECARQHPVGLRCKECARELRSPLYKVGPLQVAGGLVVGLAASFAAAMVLALLGNLWFIVLFLAIGIGTMVGDAVSWGAGRKRGRELQIAAGISLVIGALLAIGLIGPLRAGLPWLRVLPFSIIGPLIFMVLGTGAAVRRLR